MATEHAEGVIQITQSLGRGGVAAVRQPAISGEQPGRADELVRVPPEGGARGGAAGTEYALVQAIQLGALFGGLQVLTHGRQFFVVDEEGFDLLPLGVELGHVDHQIADHRQAWQGADNDVIALLQQIGERGDAGKTVLAIHVETVRSTDPFAAGAAEGERGIQLLELDQCVEHHHVGTFRNIKTIFLHMGDVINIRIVSVDRECDVHCAGSAISKSGPWAGTPHGSWVTC